jgi:hypothetical protein
MKVEVPPVKQTQPPATHSLKAAKKAWQQPEITELHIRDTKGGDFNAKDEGSFWFITWGPHS